MRKWWLAPVIGAGLLAATVGVSAFAVTTNQSAKKAEVYQQLDLFADILAKAQANYVTEFDTNEAVEAAINGMLASLDPHSSYLDPEDFKDMQTQTSGEYGGLGIEVTAQDGFVKVVSPMDGTPAARAGIKSGDFLTAIDGKSIVGLPLNDAVKQMRGPVGAPLNVTVVRDGVEPFDVNLTREVIRPEVVKTKAVGDVGYIRITTFNEQTVKALDGAMEKVRKDVKGPLKGLVLDLRDNPGGLLEASIEVTSRFVKGGEVVSTRGRREGDQRRYNAVNANRFPEVPIVVLVNGGDADIADVAHGFRLDHFRADHFARQVDVERFDTIARTATVTLRGAPTGPRICFTASFSGRPTIDLPSMAVRKSPDLMPARAAGVPSIGDTTFTKPSCAVTSMPRPPYSPEVCVCMSLKSSGSR